ncbi:DUF4365 domain-containing protein [Burkholderia glumae]|uniref:DUF4365 domain-containing protein n=1 Tax=Burkholderia glumae TaxID=337 RepID=UPI002036C0D7|nr:DUF4365 domain-containing protein [Burkholderia glumae]MCM2549262.1 DUF4365 domain-containing protein [Burkholderia glumae]
MEIGQRKARLSLAYIEAVAARAGYQVSEPRIDDDSVDGILMGREGRRPRIEFQAKATARDVVGPEHISFPLTIKNYNDLRVETIVPRLLIVLTMPDDEQLWLNHSEQELALRHCCYWMSLLGLPATENGANVTVHLPRTNQFDSATLAALMARVENGEAL